MEAGSPSSPIAKRTHRKSRAGCKNCKKRKVKCDERRPLCTNCEKHYVNLTTCEWDATLPQRARSSAQTSSVSSALATPGEDAELRTRGRIAAPPRLEDVGTGLADPFSVHPPSQIDGVDRLMSHYIAQKAYHSFPFFNTPSILKAWWPFARDDIVLFHVVLQLSAWELVRKGGKKDVEKLKRLMALSVRLLNERLEDPELGLSDATIVAVAHLAAIESERGDTKALASHLNGLRRMIMIRGGLDAIKESNSVVANTIYWIALVTASDPLLVHQDFKFDSSGVVPDWLRVTAEPIRFDFTTALSNPELARYMEDVDLLSQRFSSAVHSSSTDDNMQIVSAVSLTVQHLLYEAADVFNTAVAICCSIAGTLHLVSPLGGYYPDSTFAVNALLFKLKSTLGSVLEDESVEPTLKLWLLYVGGVSAVYMPERDWFVRHLVATANDLGLDEWKDVRPALTFLMTHAVFCENAFLDLWLDVEKKRKQLQLDEF